MSAPNWKPERRRYVKKPHSKRGQRSLPLDDRANGCGHSYVEPKCGYCERKAITRQPRTCEWCKRAFWPYKHNRGWSKFCNAKCYFAHQRRDAFETLECSHCEGVFTRPKVRTRPRKWGVFCSRACFHGFYIGERSPLWRGDKDPNRGPEWRRLAERIRARDVFRCRRCGKSEAENLQKLSVDHVIPWRAFENKSDANDPSNLVSLCRSCHQKKTIGAERKWLRGDVIDLQAYRRHVGIA